MIKTKTYICVNELRVESSEGNVPVKSLDPNPLQIKNQEG